MKLIFCFICCFLFSLHASIRAQKQMVTLKLEKTSVAEAIRELKQQTRLDFFFSNKEVNVKKTVSLNCENMRIDEVLQQLLGTEFQFEFVDNMVIITPGFRKSEEETKSVLYKGTVCDSQGQPLPGVTVAVKGTSLGVATDVNGNFSIIDILLQIFLQNVTSAQLTANQQINMTSVSRQKYRLLHGRISAADND